MIFLNASILIVFYNFICIDRFCVTSIAGRHIGIALANENVECLGFLRRRLNLEAKLLQTTDRIHLNFESCFSITQ